MTIATNDARFRLGLARLTRTLLVAVSGLLGTLALPACGDDDDGLSQAQGAGVGAACVADEDCARIAGQPLRCLNFKGGYCGLEGCRSNADCPSGSACVAHDDGVNYCFLICGDKPECNFTRPADVGANCSSSIDFAEAGTNVKACIPPSG